MEERLQVKNARLKRQLAEQAGELAIIKGCSVLRQEPEVKYAFMQNFEQIQGHNHELCAGRLPQRILPLPAAGRTACETAPTAHGS